MYDTIVVPTDGGYAAERAVEHGVALAAAFDADLHALYVVDETVYSAYSGDEYVDAREGPEHGLEEEGEAALADAAERAADAGVSVVRAMEHGLPHEVIVEYADEHGADLTVMGTRRRAPEYRQVLGSTTDRVTRLSTESVLVVKSPPP